MAMAISTKAIPVKAHWSIRLVKQAYPVLWRAYQIITDECKDIQKELALQMAVKAVNNTTGPNGLVPTLLVYGAYLRISKLDPPAPSITEQAAAIWKAMAKIVKLWAKQTVNNALHYCNRPNTTLVYNLLLNSEVFVWRESSNWNRPYHLLAVENEMCCVQLLSGPTSFKSMSIKSYFQPEDNHNVKPDELETPVKPDELEAPAEPDKLEAPLFTIEVL